MRITPQTTVAEIAARYPATTPVFERYHIDFCCGGDRPLEEVCRDRGVSSAQLIAELEAAATTATAGGSRDWTTAPLSELVDHLLAVYHAPLREELPRLERMVEKVRQVHADRYPEVVPPLAEVFSTLKAELEAHMQKEEGVLFPSVVAFEQARRQEWPTEAAVSLAGPITVMRHEHDDAGRLLADLRRLTGEYTLPDGACATLAGLYHGLAALERALREHIHLENNVLFPRALALRG